MDREKFDKMWLVDIRESYQLDSVKLDFIIWEIKSYTQLNKTELKSPVYIRRHYIKLDNGVWYVRKELWVRLLRRILVGLGLFSNNKDDE